MPLRPNRPNRPRAGAASDDSSLPIPSGILRPLFGLKSNRQLREERDDKAYNRERTLISEANALETKRDAAERAGVASEGALNRTAKTNDAAALNASNEEVARLTAEAQVDSENIRARSLKQLERLKNEGVITLEEFKIHNARAISDNKAYDTITDKMAKAGIPRTHPRWKELVESNVKAYDAQIKAGVSTHEAIAATGKLAKQDAETMIEHGETELGKEAVRLLKQTIPLAQGAANVGLTDAQSGQLGAQARQLGRTTLGKDEVSVSEKGRILGRGPQVIEGVDKNMMPTSETIPAVGHMPVTVGSFPEGGGVQQFGGTPGQAAMGQAMLNKFGGAGQALLKALGGVASGGGPAPAAFPAPAPRPAPRPAALPADAPARAPGHGVTMGVGPVVSPVSALRDEQVRFEKGAKLRGLLKALQGVRASASQQDPWVDDVYGQGTFSFPQKSSSELGALLQQQEQLQQQIRQLQGGQQ